MKSVGINTAINVADKNLFGGKDFNDLANRLWRDNLPFNVLTRDGLLSEEAKDFIKERGIKRKDFNETWADALFRHAELYEFGYQCDKAPKKRSDVKFSGAMIMSNFMDRSDVGENYELKDDSGKFEKGIDLNEMAVEDSYVDPGTETVKFRGVEITVPKHARTIVTKNK